MLGWQMSVRMTESQYSYDAASEGPSEDPRLLRVTLLQIKKKKSLKDGRHDIHYISKPKC